MASSAKIGDDRPTDRHGTRPVPAERRAVACNVPIDVGYRDGHAATFESGEAILVHEVVAVAHSKPRGDRILDLAEAIGLNQHLRCVQTIQQRLRLLAQATAGVLLQEGVEVLAFWEPLIRSQSAFCALNRTSRRRSSSSRTVGTLPLK
jgi:hypothetical protein